MSSVTRVPVTTDSSRQRLKCPETKLFLQVLQLAVIDAFAAPGKNGVTVREAVEAQNWLTGVPCLPTDDEAAAHNLKRKQQIEEAITIVSGPGGWYVVQVPGRHAMGGPAVDILYGPLESKEAADCARRDVVSCMVDGDSRYGPSEVPNEVWNLRGMILRCIRDNEGNSPEGLAAALGSIHPSLKSDREGVLERIAMWNGNDDEDDPTPF